MLVAGLGPHRVVGEFFPRPVQVELATDKPRPVGAELAERMCQTSAAFSLDHPAQRHCDAVEITIRSISPTVTVSAVRS